MSKSLKGDDRILSKIKALLDKAQSTDSLPEKEACMLKAQELMQNNHIEHSRVSSYDTMKEEGVEEDEILYDEAWESYLLHYIALNNFCKVIAKGAKKVPDFGEGFEDQKCETMIKPGEFKEFMTIIGEPTNVNMCFYLYSFFRHAILQCFIKAYNKFLEDNEVEKLKLKMPRGHKQKFMTNYLNGCVVGVHDKMKKQKENAESSNSDLRGLIIVKNDKVRKYVTKHYPNLRSGSGTAANEESAAFNKGYKDGHALNAHAGVETGNRGYIG